MAQASNIDEHPCLDECASRSYGRIHLPVAPRCNIRCSYCDRRYDCTHENRPGVTAEILTPAEALKKVQDTISAHPYIKVAGIAGPGDALYNRATFDTFRLVGTKMPTLLKCLSTNGLLLPQKIEELKALDVASITVTVNAVDARIGEKIVSAILFQGKLIGGLESAKILMRNQLDGIALAADAGLKVKVNTVFIPGINDKSLPAIAKKIAEAGAAVQNIMPLIPIGKFSHMRPPSADLIAKARLLCSETIRQITHCRQCRADAVGLIGSSPTPRCHRVSPEIPGAAGVS